MSAARSKGWPAFLAVAAAVVLIAVLLDAVGVELATWARVLYAFFGVCLGGLAASVMARQNARRQQGS